MNKYNIHLGDAVQWANKYKGELFHALFCDAPYEMEFMNKGWDGSGVAFDPKTWKTFAKVLHPGAFLFVYAGTVNDDLISVAMREAGLRKFHKMMGWTYASGFPKATRIDNQIEDEKIKEIWQGHRYGLQALKPAIETILIFQKPYEGRPLDSIIKTGAGALNINAGRIESDGRPMRIKSDSKGNENAIVFNGRGSGWAVGETMEGRWPANFILMDEEAAKRLDEQSGNSISKMSPRGGTSWGVGTSLPRSDGENMAGHDDEGGASRFFFQVYDQIDESDPIYYCAKASRAERDAGLEDYPLSSRATMSDGIVGQPNQHIENNRNIHPTVKPISLNRYLSTLLLPPKEYVPRRIFIPFAGVASEMIGAIQAGWEFIQGVEITPEYVPIAQARLEHWKDKPITYRPKPIDEDDNEGQMSFDW